MRSNLQLCVCERALQPIQVFLVHCSLWDQETKLSTAFISKVDATVLDNHEDRNPQDERTAVPAGARELLVWLSFNDLKQVLWNQLWYLKNKNVLLVELWSFRSYIYTFILNILAVLTLTSGGRELSRYCILAWAEPRLFIKRHKLWHSFSVLCLSEGVHCWKTVFSRAAAEACQALEISTPFDVLQPSILRPFFQKLCGTLSRAMKPS